MIQLFIFICDKYLFFIDK